LVRTENDRLAVRVLSQLALLCNFKKYETNNTYLESLTRLNDGKTLLRFDAVLKAAIRQHLQ
jgi:hypothetical protein